MFKDGTKLYPSLNMVNAKMYDFLKQKLKHFRTCQPEVSKSEFCKKGLFSQL